MEQDRILDIDNLSVSFDTYAGEVQAVRGVSFHLNRGELISIVGESGCGKSVTVQSIIKLLPDPPVRYKSGSIRFEKKDLMKLSYRDIEEIRGRDIAMILQDPMTSLNPTMAVGKQISESLVKHAGLNMQQARPRTIELLEMVGLPNPQRRMKQYPHEFSGGMRQRVCIAIALACNPRLLIADEPTTALDVTIQAQILDLLKELQEKLNTSIILITHDLGVVAEMADRIIVMYAGKVVESGMVNDIFFDSKHPYTWGLLNSVPKVDEQNKKELLAITGSPPDLFQPPAGCAFAARCEYAMKICYRKQPPEFDCGDHHMSSCWLLHPDAPKIVSPVEKAVPAHE